MSKPRILFSIPTRTHVGIAVDEMTGMRRAGYAADPFSFSGRDGVSSAIGRFWLIIGNACRLVKKAYQFHPDIIYFNSRLEVLASVRDAITIFIFKTFYRHKVKFLIKSHGSDVEVINNRSYLIHRLTLPYLKKNIAGWLFLSSEENKAVSKGMYFKLKTLFTTKNIVRTDQFKVEGSFKASLGIPEDYKVLLFTGRIMREKGIYEVIEAFSRINDNYKVKLIIIGDGEDYEDIKQLITNLGIAQGVILTGFIPEQDVTKYYANSDILVFPTYFPEGFPMSLFNSVGAGLSIITTHTRAASDFLTAPENCLWAEPKNAGSVYAALCKLLSSESLMVRMKENNIEKAKLFSQVQVCAELEVIMNTVIANPLN